MFYMKRRSANTERQVTERTVQWHPFVDPQYQNLLHITLLVSINSRWLLNLGENLLAPDLKTVSVAQTILRDGRRKVP